MPSRRAHTKSRHGCVECKAHKVKCDESRPSCARCTKRSAVCHYKDSVAGRSLSSLPSSYAPSSWGQHQDASERLESLRLSARTLNTSIIFPGASGPAAAAAAARAGVDQRRTARFPTQDLELLHHYTTSSYLSLSSDSSHNTIWQTLVPTEAFSRPFLLHGLLGVAAFQLAHLQPTAAQQYTNVALYHYTTAVALFRPELDDLSPENAPSVFIFANLVVCMAFAIWHTPDPQTAPTFAPAGSLQSILDIFSLERGVHGVLQVSWAWMLDSKFAALVAVDTSHEDNPLSVDGDLAFRSLEARVHAEAESESEKTAYLDAMRLLKVCHPRASGAVEAKPLIMSWPVLASTGFSAALNDRKQLALAILAYYGTLLHFLKDTWWVGDMGRRLVAAVCEQLPNEWEPVMEWARLEVGLIKST